MKKLIALFAAFSLMLASCSTTGQPGSVQPIVEVAVLVAAHEFAKKDSDNVGKILDIATILELAADATSNTLTKEQFLALVQKVDTEWSYLGVVLYNYYAKNVVIPEEYSKHSATLRNLATILRDSVLGIPAHPAK